MWTQENIFKFHLKEENQIYKQKNSQYAFYLKK